MGVNAQVASMRKRVEAAEASERVMQERLIALSDTCDDLLKRNAELTTEVAQYERISNLTADLVDAVSANQAIMPPSVSHAYDALQAAIEAEVARQGDDRS